MFKDSYKTERIHSSPFLLRVIQKVATLSEAQKVLDKMLGKSQTLKSVI